MEEVSDKGLLDVPGDLWQIIVQDDWTTNDVLRLRSATRKLWHDKKLLRQQVSKWLEADLRGLTDDMDVILEHCKNYKVHSPNWRLDIEKIHAHLNTCTQIPEDDENWNPELKDSVNNMIQATPTTLLYNDDDKDREAEINLRRICSILQRFLATEDNYATVALQRAANHGSQCLTWSQLGKRSGFLVGPISLFFGLLFRFTPWETAQDIKRGHDIGVALIVLGVILFCASGAAELYSNPRARGAIQNGLRHFIEFCRPASQPSRVVEVADDVEAQLQLMGRPG